MFVCVCECVKERSDSAVHNNLISSVLHTNVFIIPSQCLSHFGIPTEICDSFQLVKSDEHRHGFQTPNTSFPLFLYLAGSRIMFLIDETTSFTTCGEPSSVTRQNNGICFVWLFFFRLFPYKCLNGQRTDDVMTRTDDTIISLAIGHFLMSSPVASTVYSPRNYIHD
jgi:hypothetical protein